MKNEMRVKALVYLSKHNPLADLDVDQGVYARWLLDFARVRGDEAVISLAGFHMWCMKHIKSARDRKVVLTNTFFHDLMAKNNPHAILRSRGQGEHFNSLLLVE